MPSEHDWAAVDAIYAPLYDTDWMRERPPAIAQAYRDYPPWHFYVSSHGAPKRVYGFLELEDGEVRAHTVTAMIGMVNDTICGTPLEDLVRVDAWDREAMVRIQLSGSADLFLGPHAWQACRDEE
jgi:hypothetical protein